MYHLLMEAPVPKAKQVLMHPMQGQWLGGISAYQLHDIEESVKKGIAAQSVAALKPASAADLVKVEVFDSLGKRKIPQQIAKEYEDSVREIAGRIWAEREMTMDDYKPFRIRAVWRITRELARLKGLITDDEPLTVIQEPYESETSPWIWPRATVRPYAGKMDDQQPSKSFKQARVSYKARKIGVRAEDLSEAWQHFRVVKDEEGNLAYEYQAGTSLMPPSAPMAFRNQDSSLKENYEPEEDKMLMAFLGMVEAIVDDLGLWDGSKNDPHQGEYGLKGTLDPYFVRGLWPSVDQILLCEARMIEEALDLLEKNSMRESRRQMSQAYGLRQHELDSIMKMALSKCNREMSIDEEQHKALMLMRLEHVISDASSDIEGASNLPVILRAIDRMAIITGVGQNKQDDVMQVMLQAMKAAQVDRTGHGDPFEDLDPGEYRKKHVSSLPEEQREKIAAVIDMPSQKV